MAKNTDITSTDGTIINPKKELITVDKTHTHQILPNQRVFSCGRTGSGKTYLAHKFLLNEPRLIVFDTKANLSRPNEPKADWKLSPFSFGELSKKEFRLQVTDMDDADKICYYVMQRGNCRIYIDEAYSIWAGAWNDPETKNVNRCFTQGREKGIGMWVSTQRPSNLSPVVITEAEHWFIFKLLRKADRKSLAENVSDELEQMIPDEHGFYYMNIQLTAPIYFSGG